MLSASNAVKTSARSTPIAEPGTVIADLAEDPGAEHGAQPGEAGQNRCVGMLVEGRSQGVEGGQKARGLLAQQRAQFVRRLLALPHRVLLARAKTRTLAASSLSGGQRPMRGRIGAQNVGQHQRIAGIALGPC